MITDTLINKLKYKDLFIKSNQFDDETFCFCCLAFFKKGMKLGTYRNVGFCSAEGKSYKKHKNLPCLTIDNLNKVLKDFHKFVLPESKPTHERLIFIIYKNELRDKPDYITFKPRKNTFKYNISSLNNCNTGRGRFMVGNGNKILKWCYYDELYEYILELSK
jgi:hypothetical protein